MDTSNNYYQKYIKYKSKYLNLKPQTAGSKYCSRLCENRKWEKEIEKRSLELKFMKMTDSYVPFGQLSKRSRIYYIHDNGGRPFKIVANNDGIQVLTSDDYCVPHEKIIYKNPLIHIKKFFGYWDGFDSSPYEMHGNTILVQIKKHRYIYITNGIYQFDTDDEIVDFVSYVGNNDVAYPIALGTHNIYFLAEDCTVPKNKINTPITIANTIELYQEYYTRIDKKSRKCTLKNYKVLQERYFDTIPL